jgi:uncharacterized protein (TIGR02284 family)
MKTGNRAVDYLVTNLIDTCEDGEESFRLAAEDVHTPSLQSILMECAQQRKAFSRELETCAPSPNRSAEQTVHMLGGLHRSWLQFRFAAAAGDEHAILAECERGEVDALEEYRKALESRLPAPLAAIVERQYRELQDIHNRMQHLSAAPTP